MERGTDTVPAVHFDIRPGSCPNPLAVNSGGVIPAAILGTAELDVHTVDVASLRLEGVAPLRSGVNDVTRPGSGDQVCDCTAGEPDGFDDLTLKFSAVDILAALGPLADKEVRVLTITGKLGDGRPFEARDCVIVRASSQRM